MVTCPSCDAVLDVEEEELDEGDELTCEECGQTLTVKGTDPLELHAGELAEDEDEEDEDEEDLDEDDEEGEEEDEEEEDW